MCRQTSARETSVPLLFTLRYVLEGSSTLSAYEEEEVTQLPNAQVIPSISSSLEDNTSRIGGLRNGA